MAYLTLPQATKRMTNELMKGVARTLITTDEMAYRMPFVTFKGPTIRYSREGKASTAAFIADSGEMPAPSVGTDDDVLVHPRVVGSDIDVSALANDLSDGQATSDQIPKKTKAVWQLIKEKMVSGNGVTGHVLKSSANPFSAIDAIEYGPGLDSEREGVGLIEYTHVGQLWQFRAPGDRFFGDAVAATTDGKYVLKSDNGSKWIKVTLDVSDASQDGQTSIAFQSSGYEFDGMNRLVDSSMVKASDGANGDPFTFSILDHLMYLEKERSNRAFILNGLVMKQVLSLLRSTGGTNPMNVALEGYTGEVVTYMGIPILTNDNILNNESKGTRSNLTSIYLASLDPDVGLFLGCPGTGDDAIDVEGDPRNKPVLGFKIENLGPLESYHRRRTRVTWTGALGLKSIRALARASEIVSQ